MRSKPSRSEIDLVRDASAPILADLARVGFTVDWVSDLYAKRLNYQKAIPVLLDWLPRIENIRIKETIVRALSIPSAKPAAALPLLNEFRRANLESSGLKWAIGNALSVVADDSVCTEIINLAQDKRHGRAREMLVLSLGNMSSARVADILIDFLSDEDVDGHAIMALGKLRVRKAHARIERFLKHPKTWVRNEAKKALLKIEREKN